MKMIPKTPWFCLIAGWTCLLWGSPLLRADETCMSPYMPKITGHEEFIYVWTLGVEGLGDGSDKVVTIDVRPGSKTRGQVIHTVSVGGRREAHHGGFTDDRRELWLSGLGSSHIFVFDVATDPSQPRLVRTFTDFEETTGAVGPHGFYALPGRMLVPCLSNTKDRDGRTALVEYSNQGTHIATHWMPTFTFEGSCAELQRDAARFADPIAQVPGLLWKVWMVNPDRRSAGGVYLFADQAALTRFADGPIAARINNRADFKEMSMKVFDIMERPSRTTRAPLPPLEGIIEEFPVI